LNAVASDAGGDRVFDAVSARALLTLEAPKIVETAVQAARALEAGTGSEFAVLTAESALRGLIEKIVLDHARMPERTGLRCDEFTVVDNGEDWAEVSAPMAFCPESALVAHGPFMIARLCAMVLHLWGDAAVPCGLRRVRFMAPVRNDMVFHIARSREEMPAELGSPILSGTILTVDGGDILFAGYETDSPVGTWIDNFEIDKLTKLTRLDGPDRAFRVDLALTDSADADEILPATLPEAVQIILEAMCRAVTMTRNLDGRGILLGGIRSMSWPENLLAAFADGISMSCVQKPSKRKPRGTIWRHLPVFFEDLGDTAGPEACLLFVEAHTNIATLLSASDDRTP
jgi:hypothetical protein